jgi:hypothetical protein
MTYKGLREKNKVSTKKNSLSVSTRVDMLYSIFTAIRIRTRKGLDSVLDLHKCFFRRSWIERYTTKRFQNFKPLHSNHNTFEM